jgi:hypothetical protein
MALLVLGIALVIIGLILLFVKEGTAESKGFGFEVKGPVGVVVLLAGVGCVGGYAWLAQNESGDRRSPEVGAQAPPSGALPTVTEPANIKVASVKNGEGVAISTAVVQGKAGLNFGGSSIDLGTDSLWVFDYDPNDDLYYGASDGPLRVKEDGRWSFVNTPIGAQDASDKGTTYRIVVVRATQDCSSELGDVRPDAEGEVVLKTLPAGCTEAAWVNVLKTGP